MKSYVQVLTTPTVDSPGTTLLLHFDNKRYLIGSLAEGTQRACVQIGARLLKVSECFLTGRTEWRNTGGLIGMILTLADSSAASQASSLEEVLKKAKTKAKRLGVVDDPQKMKELEDQAKKEMSNTLSIFGPPNLNHTLATARRYVFRKGMPVNVHEIRDSGLPEQLPHENEEWKPYWADENIKVWPMSILPKSASSSQSPPASISPRKRSFDEMQADANGAMTAVASELSQKDRDYLTVKAVVGEMFNSSWRLDTLYETALADVKLPATIFVRNAQTNKIEKYTGPLPGDAKNPPSDPQMKVLVRRPWPGALVESLPDNKPAKEAISYIIRNHMQRGTFRPERAKALKVKSGPDYSKLAKGESVTNSDGETVTPEQVMDPPRVGGGIAVVDLPGPEYVENLVNRPEWRTKQVMEGVGAIMWICGKEVAKGPKLHAFMQEFQHLKHIVSSPDCCPNNISLDSVAGSTIRLKEVDPERYIVPVHDEPSSLQIRQVGGQKAPVAANTSALPGAVHVAQRGQLVQLEPTIEVQSKEVVPTLDVAQIVSEMPQDVMDEARKAQEATKTIPEGVEGWLGTLPSDAKDAEVITLGTGSALPSKYRNVSSTLVRVPGWGNILLDAGENTIGQLQRVFPAEDFKQVLRDLRLLCISHMHADHQLGTTSVIKAWYQEVHDGQPAPPISSTQSWKEAFQDQRLAVISEPAMQHWLYEYSALEDYGYSRLAPLSMTTANPRTRQPSRMSWFIPPSELKGLSTSDYRAKLDEHVVDHGLLDLQDIQAVAVQHCHGARAISITLPSGFKVSYSGDCRPSMPFTQIGKGSTVCIHEATFDDELQGDAEAKNHSTTSEALDIAQRMGAKACVLTHFSQRYQKVPVLERADETEMSAEEDVDMSNGAIEPVEDESTNPEDAMAGPLEDVAATFPDQETSNGAGGKQYDIPSKKQASRSFGQSGPPEAVKFKLQSDMKVCVAFDYMRVKVGDIWKMEHFTPALLKLFAEEEKEVKDGEENGNASGKKDKKNKAGKSKRNN
ncbi:Ribonuclease Z [Pseudocercospora fuligena]|uniref:ribonuclease Z n=1 Tax=Pseudocercospora fuligena TaxID=685502 RepID=A0A8H6VCN9_9PEZI|nr:Ribonuclease Z [Pseudocercospora fuligena]